MVLGRLGWVAFTLAESTKPNLPATSSKQHWQANAIMIASDLSRNRETAT